MVVQVTSYANPTNRCEECGQQRGLSQTCCDATRNNSCTGSTRCDNQFSYCLRAVGTKPSTLGGCNNTTMVTTEVNFNGEVVDFNQSTVLGLPNPLSLTGLARRWEVSVEAEVTSGSGLGCGLICVAKEVVSCVHTLR